MDVLERDGPQLFPLRAEAAWTSYGKAVSGFCYILVYPPAAVEAARLTVTNRMASYTAEGEDTGGAFLFIMPPHSGDDNTSADWWYPENCVWEITYLDAEGNEIES